MLPRFLPSSPELKKDNFTEHPHNLQTFFISIGPVNQQLTNCKIQTF